ncbi:hypothetical protein LJR013_003207 [Pseudarthrobacter oxydans]|uniref:hypothetical protein n=1 Tax=Pseudarthrobacter oxydans TaxID=1671 RepID=UPI003ECD9DF3
MTEAAAMEHPARAGLRRATERAREFWPDLDVDALAQSEAVVAAAHMASEQVEDEKLSHVALNAASVATAEAAALAAMSREASKEPQLSPEEIGNIKSFVRWIFNGLWERE